jgi:hypothetical protein
VRPNLLTAPSRLTRTQPQPAPDDVEPIAAPVVVVVAPADGSTAEEEEEQDWRVEGYYGGSGRIDLNVHFVHSFSLVGNESFEAKFAWFADPYSTEVVETTRRRDTPDYSPDLLLLLKVKHDQILGKYSSSSVRFESLLLACLM